MISHDLQKLENFLWWYMLYNIRNPYYGWKFLKFENIYYAFRNTKKSLMLKYKVLYSGIMIDFRDRTHDLGYVLPQHPWSVIISRY